MLVYSIGILVVITGILNLFRMSIFLIGSDIYGLIHHINKRKRIHQRLPSFDVVIPAHNEANSIIQCVTSVLSSDYPQELLNVVVVDDGSTDDTKHKLQTLKKSYKGYNLKIITQQNYGKAYALNTGMKHHSHGELVMCLDADSYLTPNALRTIVWYFQNPNTMALAANVKIAKRNGLLNLIQTMEYIICYQMKRAQNILNIEYIIGGIGSTFRRSFLSTINYYDANTVTEDIDITMKILQHGNKKIKIDYGIDVVVYTQSVLTIPDLIRQRFRWKWGRYQTFLKHTHMFFSADTRFTKGLSWVYLPYALLSDVLFLIEPVILLYILFITFYFHDWFTIVSAFIGITCYMWLNIIAEETMSKKEKIQLLVIAPTMYLFFYILSYVEYVALIKSLVKIRKLKQSIAKDNHTWNPVQKLGYLHSTVIR